MYDDSTFTREIFCVLCNWPLSWDEKFSDLGTDKVSSFQIARKYKVITWNRKSTTQVRVRFVS